MKMVSKSLEETQQIACDFLEKLARRNKTGATVVALEGDLGAGKTALVQSLARELGVTDSITSPTFVIEKVYALPEGKVFKKLVHIDAYRLEKKEELEHLGFAEIAADSENLICLEWPGNVPGILPENTVTVTCRFINQSEREYSYESC